MQLIIFIPDVNNFIMDIILKIFHKKYWSQNHFWEKKILISKDENKKFTFLLKEVTGNTKQNYRAVVLLPGTLSHPLALQNYFGFPKITAFIKLYWAALYWQNLCSKIIFHQNTQHCSAVMKSCRTGFKRHGTFIWKVSWNSLNVSRGLMRYFDNTRGASGFQEAL